MRLSQKADYAMRMMVDLAGAHGSQRMTIGDIARRQDVPEPFMAKIAMKAAAAGLVDTRRGTGGGVALARPAERITLLEVVEAIDGPIEFMRCTVESGRCSRTAQCTMRPVWEKAKRQFEELLSVTRLSEVTET